MAEAFGKYVNSACEKAGKDLLKKAKEAHVKRKEDANKDIASAAHDIASGLVGVGKKRIMLYPEHIKAKNIMSNADRRERGFPQDPDLEDYQEEVVHAEKC
jgi:hypothetical protein